jgi:glycosyltransferase involved in cell wall biosynthesis
MLSTVPPPARVLLLCSEPLRERLAGPAIRTWEMARALSRRGHPVTVATLGAVGRQGDGFRLVELSAGGAEALVDESDVVVIQGAFYATMPWLADKPQVQIMDLYDPYHVELLPLLAGVAEPEARRRLAEVTREVSAQLARADLVLCASERQRDLWNGHLAALGRLLDVEREGPAGELVTVVPFGVSDEPFAPRRSAVKGVVDGIEPGDFLLLWAGGIYDWFDPLTLIDAVAASADRAPGVRLFFLATTHPNPEHPAHAMVGRAQERARELGVLGSRVFFNESWVPFEDRADYLGDGDIGVTTHAPSLETRYSYRTRNLDYLWAGIPLITTEGDVFGDAALAEGFGASVPAGDVAALADRIAAAAASPELVSDWAEGARAAGERRRWSVVLSPLLDFCANPRRAPGPSWLSGVGGAGSTPLRDALTAVRHLREGGPRLLLERVRGRVRRDRLRRPR